MSEKEREKIETKPHLLTIEGSEIRLEDSAKFEESFFREEYIKILRAVNTVVERTETDRKMRKNLHDNELYYPDIRIHNIVPIIGPRGSGKSSILHTVAAILQDSYNQKYKAQSCLREFYSGSNLSSQRGLFAGRRFFVTESIDGSLLEPHEDIFTSILAQMDRTINLNYSRTPLNSPKPRMVAGLSAKTDFT